MSNVATIAITVASTMPFAAIVGAVASFRLNRASAAKMLSEAQTIAQKSALDSFMKMSARLQQQCNRCEADLEKVKKRLDKRNRVEDGLLDVVVEVVPLLEAGDERTKALRAAIRTVRQSRYDDEEDDIEISKIDRKNRSEEQ